MISILKGKYRLCRIAKIINGGIEEMPVEYGLGLEMKCNAGTKSECYIVVCFFKPDGEGDVSITSIDERIFNIPSEDYQSVCELAKIAMQTIRLTAATND